MNIRPLPYYNTDVSQLERDLAASLRAEFVPKITRRLPGHHLRGFRHTDIVATVKRCKRAHPWFVRTDISRFYPSVRHMDLVVGVQLAYRDLLGLDYVPSAFKRTYVGPLMAWCRSLPLTCGIPLGSPLSAIAAPLMLVPVWLGLKRRFGLPFLVYVDDVLVFCDSGEQAAEVYAFLERSLASRYDLHPNPAKTYSGRFAGSRVDFCGWSFAGGYARVSEAKAVAFAERVAAECRRGEGVLPGVRVKRLNRLIYGFGHYYKYGDVKKQYASLDCLVRKLLREQLTRYNHPHHHTNAGLNHLGLATLTSLYERNRPGKSGQCPAARSRQPAGFSARPQQSAPAEPTSFVELLGGIDRKLTQLVALQRRQLNVLLAMSGS